MPVTYVQAPTSANFPALAEGTTGGAAVGMANYGISLIAETSTEVHVLAPPQFGVQKRLICTSSSTTITPTIKLSTNTAQTVTLAVPGANTNVTMFKFAGTRSTAQATVVDLVGLSSVQWCMVNVFPVMSSGAGNGAITLSTT